MWNVLAKEKAYQGRYWWEYWTIDKSKTKNMALEKEEGTQDLIILIRQLWERLIRKGNLYIRKGLKLQDTNIKSTKKK